MNSYQRVMNTLEGQPVDRLPVFAVLGAYGATLTGVDLRTLFSDAAAYVAGQQALQTEYGFDLVLSAFDYSVIAEAFGGEVAWAENQVPNVKRPAARTAAEALRLPLPDIQTTGRLPMILQVTRQLAASYKNQVPIICALPGPCILPSLLIGLEGWMETALFDVDLAQELLAYSGQFLVDWAKALLDAGADCLVVTEGMATAEIAPRGMFVKQFLPHLQEICDRIPGPKVISSTGGHINQILDVLTDLPGLVGVITGSKDDLAETRSLIGPDLTLVGNLDNLTLPGASADQVYDLSLACLRTAASAGPFILANSGADVPQSTPPANLKAMQAAAATVSAEIGCGL